MLEERDGIKLSRETLRGWMIEHYLHRTRRHDVVPHQWRERRPCRGELLQLDGSLQVSFRDCYLAVTQLPTHHPKPKRTNRAASITSAPQSFPPPIIPGGATTVTCPTGLSIPKLARPPAGAQGNTATTTTWHRSPQPDIPTMRTKRHF